ncbi:hypothetical protein N7G274_010847 [Stereocaulon virgatum]|uniref:Uncharacterized protein n=1 Tax=Stereocaulon virgatum TaxID=373712 RepID=A0ABR3ZUC7_9LECA
MKHTKQEVEQRHLHMMKPLLHFKGEPKSTPSSSTFRYWSQSQDLEGTIARSKARQQRPTTPSTDTTNISRSRYLKNRKSKPAAGLPSVSRHMMHDTTDDEPDDEGRVDVWVGVYSPKAAGIDGPGLPVEHSQQDQMCQNLNVQSFSVVEGGLRLEEESQDGPAKQAPIDWDSFYSNSSETVPRDSFLATPSTDWSTFSDNCPITSTVVKPVPRDSYLSGPSADWATYSNDCPIKSNVSVAQSPVELMASPPVSLGSSAQAWPSFSAVDEVVELGDMPREDLPLVLWSYPGRSSSKKVKGYVNKLRHRYLVEYKGDEDPIDTPTLIFDCPREIVLTQPSPPPTAAGPSAENVSKGMLAVPPKLYKKKQREQQVIEDFLKMETLRAKRLSMVSTAERAAVTI